MGLLFAAIGATLAALIEASVVPYISVGDAGPHPVLLGGVIWTIVAGIDRGIAWAFVGGLVLDSLLGRPLGGSAFALLVAVGGAALLAQPFPRLRLVAPVVGVPILSIVYGVILIALTVAAQPGVVMPDLPAVLVPDAMYDALLGMFLGPLAVALHDRHLPAERAEW